MITEQGDRPGGFRVMKTGKRMKMEQRLYVVGIGPGGYEKMTIEAAEDQFDRIMQEVVAVCKKVEPDCVINL